MSEPGTILVLTLDSLVGGYMLWLSLYVLSRGLLPPRLIEAPARWWTEPWAAAGVSLAMAAIYTFGAAARLVADSSTSYVSWFHLSWWSIPLAGVLWLWAVAGLLNLEATRRPWALGALVFLAVLVAAAGTGTAVLFQYAGIQPISGVFDPYYIPPAQPGYALASAGLILTLWATALALAARQRRQAVGQGRRQLRRLATGNALFAAGTSLRLAAYSWFPDLLPEQIGSWIAALGLVIVGFGIVRYGALLSRRVMAHDFWRSLRGAALAALVGHAFVALVFGLTRQSVPLLMIPAITYLTVGLATPFWLFRHLLDRLTLPPWQSRFLLQLARARHDVMTVSDPFEALQKVQAELAIGLDNAQRGLFRETIQKEVDRIFRHKTFHNDAVLACSRLHELQQVQIALAAFAAENRLGPEQLSEAERARVLRRVLVRTIEERLCPAPGQPPPKPPSDQWLGYLILTKSYLEDKTRQEVIQEIARETGVRLASVRETGGRLYAQHLASARAELSDILWRAEVPPP